VVVKRKKLNDTLTLIFTPDFPYNAKKEPRRHNRVLLGIGGNIGDVMRRFHHLFVYFQRSPMLRIIETAPVLKNPPFGYREQDMFMNSLILIKTHLPPKVLLRYLLRVEKRFGRKRLFENGPRTLDIDIIFYENRVMESQELTLPHPGWRERSSVLIPLAHMKKGKND